MSRLNELIKEYCPDGVEYKTLGEVCDISKGIQFNKADMQEAGSYPVINGGVGPSGYIEQYNQEKDTITVSQGGASAGYVNWIETRFWAGAHCYVLKPKETVLNRYLYHFVSSQQKSLQNSQYGAGIPSLAKASLFSLKIPLPPLPVQREIVRILDNFSQLTAELNKQLTARKKQYEYYREQLLLFEGEKDVIWLRLDEVFVMKNGYTPSKSVPEFWTNGTIPWFRMEDIRANGRILSDSIQHITPEALKGGRLFSAGSIIMATTATIGEHALLIADSLANQQFTFFTKCKSLDAELDMKYAYYYFFIIGKWCRENVNVSSFPSVDMVKLKKYKFPIPPLEIQERIVSILDRFDALCNDLSSGLPAEISARQKQYEYYRDKLLSFKA